MEALRSRVQAATDALRRLCTELRPSALDDLNLGLAVSGYVQDVAGEWGLPITLHLPEDPEQSEVLRKVRGEIGLCLFRVLQEALANVQRHARASHVYVALAVEDGHVVLEVQDDGRGFRCPARLGALIHQGHFGLAGAQERVEMVGGTLEVASVLGLGTT
ncbi:MAG: sensor histidine kinase, partial [Chloroflexi bacterium]